MGDKLDWLYIWMHNIEKKTTAEPDKKIKL